MPVLSAFTPCGHLRLSSQPAYGQQIYQALVGDLEKAFDMTPGTFNEACAYADAMLDARAKHAIERAGNQAFGATATDFLPVLEQIYATAPTPDMTLPERRNAVALAQQPLRGARMESVVSGLRERIDSLLAVVPVASLTSSGTAITPTVYPASPAHIVDVRTPALWLQLVDPVLVTGEPLWVAYENLDTSTAVTDEWQPGVSYPAGAVVIPTEEAWTGYFYTVSGAGTSGTTEPTWPTTLAASVTDGSATWNCTALTSAPLQVGHMVTVQGENSLVSEQVTITGVSNAPPDGSDAGMGLCFQATFANVHDAGASLFTGPFPYWWSTRRGLFVVTEDAAAMATRKTIDAWMRRATRGVDLWATVLPTTTSITGGTLGPLEVGSPMGCVPFGSLGYTNSS